jgi:hypothetical protein
MIGKLVEAVEAGVRARSESFGTVGAVGAVGGSAKSRRL